MVCSEESLTKDADAKKDWLLLINTLFWPVFLEYGCLVRDLFLKKVIKILQKIQMGMKCLELFLILKDLQVFYNYVTTPIFNH